MKLKTKLQYFEEGEWTVCSIHTSKKQKKSQQIHKKEEERFDKDGLGEKDFFGEKIYEVGFFLQFNFPPKLQLWVSSSRSTTPAAGLQHPRFLAFGILVSPQAQRNLESPTQESSDLRLPVDSSTGDRAAIHRNQLRRLSHAVQMRTIIEEQIWVIYFILPQINFLSPERCRPPNICNHM
ncbi:hypothetical protein LXL04_034862 [Taraxacum kok-saghyz]